MNQRALFVGIVAAALAIGCGDDDDGSRDVDAGADSGDAGSGGRGGNGGRGGSGGRAGGLAAGSGGEGASGAGGGGAGGAGGGGAGGAGGGGAGEYSVGGTLSGLSGSGLVLKINDRDDLSPTGNGEFTFSMKLAAGTEYAVTVHAQPTDPSQTCSVGNGAGTVSDHDVTDVNVTCSAESYKVGGTVSGLTATGLVLRNNGADDLAISAAGDFAFATKLAGGAAYAVTIQTQPAGQTCALSGAGGNVGSADVTSVMVRCVDPTKLLALAGFGSATLTWNDTSATRYDLYSYTARNCNVADLSTCQNGTMYGDVHSPYTATGLTNGQGYYFKLVAIYGDDFAPSSNETGARPNKPEFDGEVLALATAADGAVYAGGAFQHLSVHTGAALPLHYETGLASEWVNFPVVDGEIYASAADGTGGVYLSGSFQRVDNAAHAYLIHVRPDGTLDPSFSPNSDGAVLVLAYRGGKLYAAGNFTMIGSATRAGLAELDGATGMATGWNPAPNVGGTASPPYVLYADANNLYVGGDFTTIATVARARLARFDASGALDTTFTPDPDQAVYAIAGHESKLYVGGFFGNIGTGPARQARVQLAELDATGNPTAWDPFPNNSVGALAVSGDGATVYVAGQFSSIGTGAGQPRAGLAALNASDGAATSWDPNPDERVAALAVRGTTVYAGGRFANIGGAARKRVAAIGTNGQALAWDPAPDGEVNAITVAGEIVYIAGLFDGHIGVTRKYAAGFDASGRLTNWNPNADDTVYALALGTGTVYAGGGFTNIGGENRNHIALLDATTGNALSWNPNADATVRAIVPAGATVYVGGEFTSINSTPRGRLAALDPTNNNPTGWIADANAPVFAIAVDGGTVYAGGAFTMVDSDVRNRIAAIDAGTGAVTAWDPNANGTVGSLAVSGGNVFAGGDFTSIGGAVRNRLAAIASGGVADPGFDPDLDGPASSLVIANDRLYVGGDFVLSGTTSRNRVAAFDVSDGTLTTWQPNVEGPVYALGVTTDKVYVGGNFVRVDQAFASNLATLAPSD